MAKKKLVKKLIVVLNNANKTDAQKISKFSGICDGVESDPCTPVIRVVVNPNS